MEKPHKIRKLTCVCVCCLRQFTSNDHCSQYAAQIMTGTIAAESVDEKLSDKI